MVVDIILLGAPGAGKGTQAELLEQWLPLPHIATGVLFRSAVEARTALGLQAKAYMDKGELVPDKVTIGMVAERLAQTDCAQGVVFDGFPRTVAQAEALDDLLAKMGRQVDTVIYVRVSRGTLLERLAGRWTCRDCGRVYHQVHNPEQSKGICDVCAGELYQRQDDMPATQARRIEVYLDQTAPLQEYYRRKGVLVEIDGEGDVQAVQRELKEVILHQSAQISQSAQGHMTHHTNRAGSAAQDSKG